MANVKVVLTLAVVAATFTGATPHVTGQTATEGYRVVSSQVTLIENVHSIGKGPVTVYVEGQYAGELPPACSRTGRGSVIPRQTLICVYQMRATLWIQNDSDKWLSIGRVVLDEHIFRRSRWRTPGVLGGATATGPGSNCDNFYLAPGGRQHWSISRETYFYAGDTPRNIRGHNIGWAPYPVDAPPTGGSVVCPG